MEIKVLGSGCTTCKNLYELTKRAVQEMELKDEVEYVTDVAKIIEMGILSTPVIIINGQVVMTGYYDDIERIKDLIQTSMK